MGASHNVAATEDMGEPTMRSNEYYEDEKNPIGATHPDYPEYFRISQGSAILAAGLETCEECPMAIFERTCDSSCGFGSVWVSAPTWIQIRVWENQR
jgi:hypothetical protein